MRFAILLFVFINCVLFAGAQSRKRSSLFNLVNEYHQKEKVIGKPVFLQEFDVKQKDSIVKNAVSFHLNNKLVQETFEKKPGVINLVFTCSGNKTYTLDLFEQKINTSGDFSFGETGADGARKFVQADDGLHYRGCVAGDSTSIAAFSIFSNGHVMGLFSNAEGNFVIGKMDGSEQYIIYNDKDLAAVPFVCASDEIENTGAQKDKPAGINAQTLDVPLQLCKKVRFYWEADYGLYRYRFNSNITAVKNYITGLFNQFAVMYQNEGIVVELAESYVWTSADPYRLSSSSSNALNDFTERWNMLGNSFNGDLALLLSGAQGYNNGGVAFRNVLCSRSYAYGYANVYGSFNTVPTYSWDVLVTTHEVGHNFGSRHTQWCGWDTGPNGACGSIDNCTTLEADGACTTCPSTTNINALPSGWQGTVMSYCHLANGVGINLSNGFGPLPQTVIRANVAFSSCLTSNNNWTGAVKTSWSNTSNWNCGTIPDALTDVTINTGVPNFPVVTNAAVCRSLKTINGASVRVNTGFSLTVTGAVALPPPVVQPPVTDNLYITGTATQAGWMNNGDAPPAMQRLNKVINTLYETQSIWINGGGEYVFVPEYGNWTDKFGYTGTRLTNNTAGANIIRYGEDLKAPATSGYYKIAVDFQKGKYVIYAAPNAKITVPPSNELFITGSATPGGWMNNGDAPLVSQQFTKISNTQYEIASVTLTANDSYVFVPVYGNWTNKYGGIGNNNTNTTASDYFQARGSDLLAPPVSGNYKITVDFQSGIFTLIKL